MKDKDMLFEWDDGKIYLYLKGEEYCISDKPKLVEKIIALCRQYYEQKAQQDSVTDE